MYLCRLKEEAEKEDKWLLINVQSNDEFASHQLNADLWGVPMIQEIVRGNFVFAQRTMPNPEAQSVVTTYDVHELPAVVIIDPHTGQKMMQWTGLIQPERFMEDVLPFLDMTPSHPSAGSTPASTIIYMIHISSQSHISSSRSFPTCGYLYCILVIDNVEAVLLSKISGWCIQNRKSFEGGTSKIVTGVGRLGKH
jgi:hypothetical protein